jgi:small subunit ribosomal protein S21
METVKVRGIGVVVNCRNERRHQQEVADALKELKKQMKKDGLMQELRRREEFVAPSKARRLKREASRKQRRRDERRAARIAREEV